jgi:putative phage-type endonuclease
VVRLLGSDFDCEGVVSLTAEQIEIRRTGVGASEVSELLRLSPYRGPIDLWLAKTGRTVPREDTGETSIGTHLEAFALALYTRRTGHRLFRPKVTLRHPEHEHVLASPDGLGRVEDLGAEAKIVGARMAHHWEHGLPDYVRTQAIQNMAVTGRARWDVVALIGGTDLRVFAVERDGDLERDMCEAVEDFWSAHVANDVPPEPIDPEERKRYLLARYPGSAASKGRRCDFPEVAEAAARLREIDAEVKALKVEEASLEADLCEIIGADYGIEGGWGKALWYPTAGKPSWKDIAEEVAGGIVPDDVIDRHRGAKGRTFRLYEPKTQFTGKRKARTT